MLLTKRQGYDRKNAAAAWTSVTWNRLAFESHLSSSKDCSSLGIPYSLLNMGKEVQIVSIGEDHTVQLNTEELERILLAPNVKDKPVAVVSIIGAFRMGKSFLMNFLLWYLSSPDKSKWMGDENTPVQGFSWSTKLDRNTKGILVWDEVFLVHTSTGDELAVLVMDTQGAFDSESSADEAANLFALSILTSSLQIYNVFHNLQEGPPPALAARGGVWQARSRGHERKYVSEACVSD
ncbi:hypothetical protein MTO96_023601 [Rhipicephalus appendiculatus]